MISAEEAKKISQAVTNTAVQATLTKIEVAIQLAAKASHNTALVYTTGTPQQVAIVIDKVKKAGYSIEYHIDEGYGGSSVNNYFEVKW